MHLHVLRHTEYPLLRVIFRLCLAHPGIIPLAVHLALAEHHCLPGPNSNDGAAPAFLGLEATGYHKSTQEIHLPAAFSMIYALHRYKSIFKCNLDICHDLYSNMVLLGGITMFPEGIDVTLTSMKVNIVLLLNRNSILTSLSTFQNLWFSKQEYDKSGPGIVHRSFDLGRCITPDKLCDKKHKDNKYHKKHYNKKDQEKGKDKNKDKE
ncbi:uncharacterized protein EDB91DRAFT_1272940 [Suillus paluster]|uniref:uncharacterized protein n=1 Tax=Suillus paluster TaxID=48578 RepID=UPI001B85F42F|nr:uncharacterized protein EDB91DRAFT_1272940 [Suillus paluster]KAG1744666.1 hypothetical protein EDB91DRAFT_1272940 [Suillus paluster]